MMNVGRVLSVLLLSSVAAQAVVDGFPYHESFENGYGEWLTSSEHDNWWRTFGSTGSYATGPSGAHDGDYYCYVEASYYYNNPSPTYGMEATFDLTALPNPTIAFRYHMYGGSMGTLYVDANTGSGWVNVLSISGQQQNGEDSPWGQIEESLSEHISANTKIRFRGTTGSSYRGDMAVDDIWIFQNQTMPHHFEWAAIEDRQFEGTSFPVQLSAVNYAGQPVKSFSGPVELTAWTEGFENACKNGDFQAGIDSEWTAYADADSPGEYIEVDSVGGSGIALAFKPDAEYDGLSQVINVSGGEQYYVTATFSPQNLGDDDVSGAFYAQILIDGVAVDTVTIYTIYDNSTYSYILSGYFVVPESEQEGTRTLSIVAKSVNGEDSNIWVYFDDVSANFAPEGALVVSPEFSGDFVNGVWNGNITMDYRLPNINLIARYVDVVGASDTFTTYVSAYDSDFDGMLDDWEEDYFSSKEACEAGADPDGDGYSNGEEFIIGTNPILKSSALAFQSRMSGESCVLDWYATEECTYDVQWTPNMRYIPFSTIAENIPYTQASFTNDTTTAGFYRIKVHKK